jgi:hypothetical protein
MQGSQRPIRESADPAFRVGDLAPDFTLPDRSRKARSLSGLVRRDTLLCFTCGCSNCLELDTYLAAIVRRLGNRAPAVLNVTLTQPDREASWERDTGLRQTFLYVKRDNPVFREYRGHPCPRIYRLRADRRVAWIGPSPLAVRSMQTLAGMLAVELGLPSTAVSSVPAKRASGPRVTPPH